MCIHRGIYIYKYKWDKTSPLKHTQSKRQKSKTQHEKLRFKTVDDSRIESCLFSSRSLAPYVLLSMCWRQFEESVLLCESHFCELSPQGCSVGVPPQQRVWEGGPKRNGWWKGFFNPSLPHPWYVKRHTNIYSDVVPKDMLNVVQGLKGLANEFEQTKWTCKIPKLKD